MNGGAVWSSLVERALLSGAGVEGIAPSQFLFEVVDELIERLRSNGRFSFCGHVSTLAQEGDLPDVIAFPGDALGCCPPCARLHKAGMQAARRRTCIRCDTARATALHQATLGAVEGFAFVTLGIPLCEGCAAAERLRDVGVLT